jgi:predicted PurR-regulated permease PerM
MQRLVAIVVLVAALAAFKPLLLLLVFFVAFERALGWASGVVRARAKLGPKAAVLAVVGAAFAAVGAAVALGAHRAAHAIVEARDTFPARFEAMKQSALFLRARAHLPDTDKVVESAQHHAQEAMHVAAELGHMLAYALIGLILAVVYRLEHDELSEFGRGLDPRSLIGTLVRWFGHVADAIAVTVQLQLLVAAFNAVTTLPVMLLLGMNHVVPLMVLVFASALVPVVGNLISGAVLVETVFSWPGLGTLAFESILGRDYPTLLGVLFFSSVLVIAANLMTDFAYRLIDPRLRNR